MGISKEGSKDMRGIVTAIACSLLCGVLHIAYAYLGCSGKEYAHPIRKLIHHWKIMAVLWGAMLPVFLFFFWRTGKNIPIFNRISTTIPFEYIYGIVFFGMFFFLYLSVYYVIDRSVSSRIMIEIDNAPEKRLRFNDLLGVYNVTTKYENELKGMREGGFIAQDGAYYRNTPKGMFVGRLAGWYKRVCRLGKGG